MSQIFNIQKGYIISIITYRRTKIVVFDGTSAYVIPAEDLAQEIEQNEVEVLGKYADFDEASDFCDNQNDTIIDRVH